MSLETTLRALGGVAVFDLRGRLLGGEGDALRDLLIPAFHAGHTRIVLNLEHVEYADSAGLGDLVASYAAITRRGGTIQLLKPRGRLLAMLRVTHIDALFEIIEDERQAFAGSLRAGGSGGGGFLAG